MGKLARYLGAAGAALMVTPATPAFAAEAERIQINPIVDARLRWESVDQGDLDADAVTMRLRAGAEAKLGSISLLAEGEGTVAPVDHYNAFPFPIDDRQRRTQFAVIADPRNVEVNRLQLQYKSEPLTATIGRQRINLDDQRWVGSVAWRQNEQTFDAARGEAKFGPVAVDLAYAVAQRTIFGEDAGPRTSFRGDFVFAGVGSKLGPLEGKLFSYLLDYEEDDVLANSSQTYGGFVSGTLPIKPAKLSFRASYARQSDYGRNPFDYAADYWSFEGGAKIAGFTLAGGWEQLGSDNGRSLQTPMATLHKFNGWADLFLTTPPAGLEDAYVSVGKAFDGVKLLPGLNANVVFHQFDSAIGDIEYGTEWDASLGFKIGKVGLLLKYADYEARDFGADTSKLWVQADWSL